MDPAEKWTFGAISGFIMNRATNYPEHKVEFKTNNGVR